MSTECRACGAPLAPDAGYCPQCGAVQRADARAYTAQPAPKRRPWIAVAVVVGGLAAVLGGGLLGLAVMGNPNEVGGASPTASPSVSAQPSGSSEPSAAASASQAASPSSAPTTAAIIPNRAIAEVTTDGLNLRSAASEDSETLVTLEPGRRAFIIGEPTDAGDLRWYRVAPFDDVEGCEGGCGLIGFVATPIAASEDPWLTEAETTCPSSPMTAEQIAVLTALEALHCYGRTEIEVTGVVDLPIHGPLNPYRYSPGWLTQEHLEYLQHAWWISYRPHPDAGLETPERGDVVRITGHFEDPAATDCRGTVDADFFGGEIPAEFESTLNPARIILDCRAAFVWTEYEVIGFEDLGECCGFPPEE
ncbi:MAG TPA: SH3 domain-containing protein [Candidatus Limnocylindria bacterium]